jgi:hypothetical protein
MGRAGDCEPWGGFCGDLGVEALGLLRCRKCYARGVLAVIQYCLTGRAELLCFGTWFNFVWFEQLVRVVGFAM